MYLYIETLQIHTNIYFHPSFEYNNCNDVFPTKNKSRKKDGLTEEKNRDILILFLYLYNVYLT